MRPQVRRWRFVKHPTLANNIGCNIAINYANSTERAEKFSNELISQYPNVKIVVIQADVGQKVACEKLVAESISQLGGLDIIISNAGIMEFNMRVTYVGWTQFCPFSNLDFPEEAWVRSGKEGNTDNRTNVLRLTSKLMYGCFALPCRHSKRMLMEDNCWLPEV